MVAVVFGPATVKRFGEFGRRQEQQKTFAQTLKVKKITTVIERGGGRVDWSHKNDLIAYSAAGDDGNADIYRMNPVEDD